MRSWCSSREPFSAILEPIFCASWLFLECFNFSCTDSSLRATLRAILREVTTLPHWVRRIIILIIRLCGDPHLSFGNPAQPDNFVCYNMGGEDGVTYDMYTHTHLGKSCITLERRAPNWGGGMEF